MDHAACHVVYVDKRAREDRFVSKGDLDPASPTSHPNDDAPGYFDAISEQGEIAEVQGNIRAILSAFNGVWICTSGASCMTKLVELNESIGTDLLPTIVIVQTFLDSDAEGHPNRASRDVTTPSPGSQLPDRPLPDRPLSPEADNVYSFHLLQHISAEIAFRNLSKLIVPIAMTHSCEPALATRPASGSSRRQRPSSNNYYGTPIPKPSVNRETSDPFAPVEPGRMLKCLDAGAIDVLTSPLQKDRIYGLVAHAYRAHIEATRDQTAFLATKRLRKRSWVGMEDDKNFAYLRESMVSNLMVGICKPETVTDNFDRRKLYLLEDHREVVIAKSIGSWDFSAHDFTDDELVHAAFLMLRHALEMPELEKWRLDADNLKSFLMASRTAYNAFVLYHNFRHVVDVLQAVFYFLIQIGTLPPYQGSPVSTNTVSSVTTLLKPFDALTLLISAIGHDVGHPGVNNAFLVALNAPLAQLYNDRSVLEAFHCAAYSQILRRYWSAAFDDSSMRSLMISSILATDMGMHFKYMAELANLQQKVFDDHGTEGWTDKAFGDYRVLVCGLLIKCADISNVARTFDIAAKWTDLLQLEFARQGEMERNVGMPTTLFGGPPELGNVTKLANSQIGFMNVFAKPLFESVTNILPAMQFAVGEIVANISIWQSRIEQEKLKEGAVGDGAQPRDRVAEHSRIKNSIGPTSNPDLSISEGLPASLSSPSPVIHLSPLIPSIHGSRPASTSAHLPSTPASQSVPELPSRRSSIGSPALGTPALGSPFNVAGMNVTNPDSALTYSRRSSGAFSNANIIHPSLQTRRSSNTVPSQLQLGMGQGQPTQSVFSSENIQPGSRRVSTESDLQSLNNSGIAAADLNRSESASGAAGGRATSSINRGVKRGDLDSGSTKLHFAKQYPPSPRGNRSPHGGRFSISDRSYSEATTNGAYTTTDRSMSQNTNAYSQTSPTETQATSFLTVDSDDKEGLTYAQEAERHGNGRLSHMPELVDVDRPGRGRSLDGESESKGGAFKTALIGGNGDLSYRGQVVGRRRSSRFLNLFRKRHKVYESP